MPTREEIDRLKDFVDSLGDEPRVLAELGAADAKVDTSESAEIYSPEELSNMENEEEIYTASDVIEGEAAKSIESLNLDTSVTPGGLDTQEQSEKTEPIESAADEIESMAQDSDLSESLDSGEELILDEESTDQISDEISEIHPRNGDESEYSLSDFGDDYDFSTWSDAEIDTTGMSSISKKSGVEGLDSKEDESQPFSLEEDDYTLIRQTLAGLPRNLKLAIEETLADERITPKDSQPLIDALIKGASPRLLAKSLWRITRRRIVLPRGHRKLSGKFLVQKRRSLTYRLIREGWPVARMILLIIFITWVLGAAAFMWIYRPLMAEHIYDMGLEAISEDDVDGAVSLFYDAWYGWTIFTSERIDRINDIVVKGWRNKQKWLEYAETFQERKYWEEAELFYEGYLEFKSDDNDARLRYADYLSDVLGKHEKAINILEDAPRTGRLSWDREYTLAAGDIYLEWAQYDTTKYEEARFRYAKALETSRNDERAYLSMVNYHLRLSDEKEIALLLPAFEEAMPGKTDAPELAAVVYAGLAEYLLARGNNKDSRRFIELAGAADPLAPEPSFIDAMYWRLIKDREREYQAYKTTLANLDARETFSRNDLRMRILSLAGVGRIQAENGEPRAAMLSYDKALKLFENARERNQIGVSAEYGQLYLEQGKLMYNGFGFNSDLILSLAENQEALVEGENRYAELVQAERYFNMAEEILDSGTGGGLPPEILYRRSYIRYVLGLGGELLDLHRVVRYESEDYEARLAFATALLVNGDFENSSNQYVRALELLDEEFHEFEGVLNSDEQQKYAELLIRYILAWNNLGVSKARSASRGGGDDDYAGALSAFTMASTYLDEVDSSMYELNVRGLRGVRSSEQKRISLVDGGRRLLLDKTTYPYVNRLRLLGIDRAEGTGYLFYSDIPSGLKP